MLEYTDRELDLVAAERAELAHPTYSNDSGTFCSSCHRIPAVHPGGALDDRAWQGPDGWMARQPSAWFKDHPELWSCTRPAEEFVPAAVAPAMTMAHLPVLANGASVLVAQTYSHANAVITGVVLARWRGEWVVWTVGGRAGEPLASFNGSYFPLDDSHGAWEAYAGRAERRATDQS